MTLFTSDNAKAEQKIALGYGAAALFCWVFQAVYETFSHGVTSNFMVLAFLIPLACGVIGFLSFSFASGQRGHLFRELLCGSCVWLTLGSIFQGVLEIYGTTNHLASAFAFAGGLQLLGAVLSLLRCHKIVFK